MVCEAGRETFSSRHSGAAARCAAFVLAAAVAGCGRPEPPAPPAEPAAAPRPDIVLISIDSLRPDHLGCYGYERPTSPTIDALAASGVRCAEAVSTTSWTLPAHAALFTGLYDSAHGLVDNGQRLADEHVTLAEILRDAGYRTAGFFGGPYLHPTFGFGQGFQTYESCMTTIPDDASAERVRRDSSRTDNPAHADVTGPRTLERFGAWLGDSADDRPLFVFLHLWDVHYDYIPPPRYVELFDPDYAGDLDARDFMTNDAIHAGMPRRDLEHLVALYDGEIRFCDDILGRILGELDALGRLEDALVIVTSDHGDEFFEHGGKGHNRTLFDEVIRIPLIFRWPGRLPAGRVLESQVRLIDVMPTILGLAGVPPPADVQGRDLGAELRRGDGPAPAAFCELLINERRLRALRTGKMKAVVAGRLGREGWYDLENDPAEQRRRTDMTPAFAQRLAELAGTLAACEALRERRTGGATREAQLDPELEERLRSLGYLGGGDREEED